MTAFDVMLAQVWHVLPLALALWFNVRVLGWRLGLGASMPRSFCSPARWRSVTDPCPLITPREQPLAPRSPRCGLGS